MPTTDPVGPVDGAHPGEADAFLCEERALYRDLVEAQPRGIYRLRVLSSPLVEPASWRVFVEAAYGVEFVSPRFCEILGLDGAAIRSNPGCVPDLVVPEDREGFAAANAEALAQRRPFRWEGRLTVAGKTRWTLWESVPRVLENGDTVWTGTVEDVTERRTAEARLKECEARFRSYFDMPLVGACITSPTKGWLEVNDRLCRMLGYSREELVRRTWSELTHPDDLQEDVLRFESVVRGEIDGYSLEKRFLCRDGTVVPVDLAVSCIRTLDGSVDYFVALLQDITERKRAERELQAHRDDLEGLIAERTAELKRHRARLEELVAERTRELEQSRSRLVEAQAVLRESEDRLSRIVAEAPFPIGLYAEDGEILLVNRAWCHITGYSPEELRTVAGWAERAYGPRKEAAQADIASRFDLSESIREGEFAIRTKDGGQRFWDFSSAPVGRLPDGRRLVTTMAMDVTERRHAEEELWAYREHLEELVRARTVEFESAARELESFSYSVSHDLRAPLRAMDGYSAVLLEDHAGRLDEEGRHYLDRIRKAAGRMGHLIDGLLNLARISRRELVGTPVDLTAMSHSIAAELRALEPERDVKVTVADGMIAEGDPRLLHAVLQNLIGNALKFTSTRPAAVVEVGCEERGGEAVFFVRDNGVGFDMAYAQKLFTPFQRLHGIDEFPGTGIGLATVQRIVVRHGGRIWAESAPGAGTTLSFTLRPAPG